MISVLPKDHQVLSPHILRRYINWLHFAGLVSIPTYYSEPWKTRCHSYYHICATWSLYVFAVSNTASVFVNGINDFGEFCMRLWESECVLLALIELVYVANNLTKFYKILALIEDLSQDHGQHPVVVRTQKIQNLFLNFSLISLYSLITGSKLLQALLPKDAKTLARTKRIYNLQNPQNTLILPLYFPGLDTSEIHTFISIHIWELFVDVWITLTVLITVTFFTFLAHDIKAYVDILVEFTSRIGEEHRNDVGQVVYYTNLLRNRYLVADNFQTPKSQNQPTTSGAETQDTDKNSAENQPITDPMIIMIKDFERDKDSYDYFYVKQIVLFQEKILEITDKTYTFYTTTLKIRVLGVITLLFLAVVVILYPTSDIPLLNRLQINGEALSMTLVFILFFYSGELIGECNLTLRTAVYCSGWYNCANRTRRAVWLFMLRNLSKNYFSIFALGRLEYDVMLRIFRGGYAFLNFVINQTKLKN
ncbi:hypothetical protein WDU94_007640 [Cyamophila willieti]